MTLAELWRSTREKTDLRRWLQGRLSLGRASRSRSLLPYFLIAPLVAFIGTMTAYPTVVTTIESFFEVDPLYPSGFIGVQNFQALLSDSGVQISLVNTILYCAIGVLLSTVLGVGIAHTLRERFRARGIILALVVVPWAVPSVVGAVIWSWIFNGTFGVLDGVLTSMHLLRNYYVWIGLNRLLTVTLIEITQVWQITPLSVLIILAALQNIPSELYEAALIDGASSWHAFRRITLPLLRPAIAVAAVQAVVLSINIFDQVYVLNSTATAGSSLMLNTYVDTFSNLNFGEGYALSLIATVVTVLMTFAVLGLVYRRVEY